MRLIEVGPRDGLQNEKTPIPAEVKLRFISELAASGLNEIEVTSFVSPKWVPQLGDAAELWPQLPSGPLYSALVPNLKGLERALEVGVERIAVFTAASDAFTQKNINMTVDQSLEVFQQMIDRVRGAGVPPAESQPVVTAEGEIQRAPAGGTPAPRGWIRGYVSTAFECPYSGRVAPETVVEVVDRLFAMGVDEVSLGDTIGVAVPKEVKELAKALEGRPKHQIAWHFHDTHGTGIANLATAFELGYTAFDASAGGLGGCPYAPGAGGNLATEDASYFLERSGVATGVDLDRLARASQEVLQILGRTPQAKSQLAAAAAAAKCAT